MAAKARKAPIANNHKFKWKVKLRDGFEGFLVEVSNFPSSEEKLNWKNSL